MSLLQRIVSIYSYFLIVVLMINTINTSIIDIELTTMDIELTTQSLYEIAIDEIRRMRDDLNKEEKQLKIDREKLKQDKRISKLVENIDVIQFNVGGEIIITTRETLTKIPKSTLSLMFNGRWEHKLQRDQNRNIFLDFNPILFRHLLDQLQISETNKSIYLSPPSQPSLVEPFKKMLRKLGLYHLLPSEKKNVITFNVGGQMITNQRTTFTQVSNSALDTIVSHSKTTNFNNESDVFLDLDPKAFQHLIKQLREQSFKNIWYSELSSYPERISFGKMLIDLSMHSCASTTSAIVTDATLVAYYSFDNGSFYDSGPNKFNGTGVNVLSVAGRINQGILFNATSAYFQASGFNLLGVSYWSYSIALWIYRFPTAIENGTIHLSALATGGIRWCLPVIVLTSSGQIAAQSYYGSAIVIEITGPTLPFETWTHVVASYSAISGVRLWVSGSLVSGSLFSASGPFGYIASGQANTITLGSSLAGTSDCVTGPSRKGQFYGMMDELRVYSRELNACDVYALANP